MFKKITFEYVTTANAAILKKKENRISKNFFFSKVVSNLRTWYLSQLPMGFTAGGGRGGIMGVTIPMSVRAPFKTNNFESDGKCDVVVSEEIDVATGPDRFNVRPRESSSLSELDGFSSFDETVNSSSDDDETESGGLSWSDSIRIGSSAGWSSRTGSTIVFKGSTSFFRLFFTDFFVVAFSSIDARRLFANLTRSCSIWHRFSCFR